MFVEGFLKRSLIITTFVFLLFSSVSQSKTSVCVSKYYCSIASVFHSFIKYNCYLPIVDLFT